MKIIKITKENFDLLASGVKPYELRAFEDLGDGGEFMLVDNITGKELAKIELFLVATISRSLDSYYITYNGDSTAGFNTEHCEYLASTPFWKPWIEHYLAKNETPAFYQVVNLEIIKTEVAKCPICGDDMEDCLKSHHNGEVMCIECVYQREKVK